MLCQYFFTILRTLIKKGLNVSGKEINIADNINSCC
jgi:hypothetical protein